MPEITQTLFALLNQNDWMASHSVFGLRMVFPVELADRIFERYAWCCLFVSGQGTGMTRHLRTSESNAESLLVEGKDRAV